MVGGFGEQLSQAFGTYPRLYARGERTKDQIGKPGKICLGGLLASDGVPVLPAGSQQKSKSAYIGKVWLDHVIHPSRCVPRVPGGL